MENIRRDVLNEIRNHAGSYQTKGKNTRIKEILNPSLQSASEREDYEDWFCYFQNNPLLAMWGFHEKQKVAGQHISDYFIDYGDLIYFPFLRCMEACDDDAVAGYLKKCKKEFDEQVKTVQGRFDDNKCKRQGHRIVLAVLLVCLTGILTLGPCAKGFWKKLASKLVLLYGVWVIWIAILLLLLFASLKTIHIVLSFRIVDRKLSEAKKVKSEFEKLEKRIWKGDNVWIKVIGSDNLAMALKSIEDARDYRWLFRIPHVDGFLWAAMAIALPVAIVSFGLLRNVSNPGADDPGTDDPGIGYPAVSLSMIPAKRVEVPDMQNLVYVPYIRQATSTVRMPAEAVKYITAVGDVNVRPNPTLDSVEGKPIDWLPAGVEIVFEEWTGDMKKSVWGKFYSERKKRYAWINRKTVRKVYADELTIASCTVGDGNENNEALYDGYLQSTVSCPIQRAMEQEPYIFTMQEQAFLTNLIIYSGNYDRGNYKASGMATELRLEISGTDLYGRSRHIDQVIELKRDYDLGGVWVTLDQGILTKQFSVQILDVEAGSGSASYLKDYVHISEITALGKKVLPAENDKS